MKKNLLTIATMLCTAFINAQVTQINSNKSLFVAAPINNVKTVLSSQADGTLWVTEGTFETTEQLSNTIQFDVSGGLLNSKFIFAGSTPATGTELYITDGTPGGTILLKDINSGTGSSSPADFTQLNGVIYFSAITATEGRELWRTDGTPAGTTLVKNIAPGSASSNSANEFNLFSNGSYLVFAAESAAAQGVELWKSDGTDAGTVVLKDINTGADSSMPHSFVTYNNMILFLAKNAANGEELWKTDGTGTGTVLVKDINPGPAGCTSLELFPGFGFPVAFYTHTFNNKVFFTATDGTSGGQVWGTDGTEANTTLLSDVVPGVGVASVFLFDAVDVPGKFIFPVSNGTTRSELWQSNGTSAGTSLFKSFDNPGEIPYIALNVSFQNGEVVQNLFQGNTFFFVGNDMNNGTELWKSDGTLANTVMVKDVNPGAASGIDFGGNISYLYTSAAFFFAANDGTNGNELWKTDGTDAGTTMVEDINSGPDNANPILSIVNNHKIIFSATDGDDPVNTDLFVVTGNFDPLPVRLTGFSVTKQNSDALLQWFTEQEINSNHFIIQRSFDALHFENIGTVQAAGNSTGKRSYQFIDENIVARGKQVIYYRIASADIDGKTQYSGIATLRLRSSGWNVQLVTNPVQQNIQLNITGAENVSVAIREMTGKLVYSNTLPVVNSVLNIPAEKLPHGYYAVTVYNGIERKTLRFIK